MEGRGGGSPSLTPCGSKDFGVECSAHMDTGRAASGCVSKAQFWAEAGGTCLARLLHMLSVLLDTRGRWEATSPAPSTHSL